MKKYIYKTIFLLILIISTVCFAEPSSSESYIKIGRDHANLFQYDKALENFKKATEIDPNNWEAYYHAGVTLIKQKKTDEAEKYLIKAHDLNYSELDVQKALGSIYINKAKIAQNNGQTAKKNEYQLKACHAYPAATKIWLSLFEYWSDNDDKQKIKEESEFLYKNNLELLKQGEDPSLQQAFIIISRTYLNDGDDKSAENYLNYASKIHVSNDELYGLKRQIANNKSLKLKQITERAENYVNNKEYEKAIEAYKEALKIGGQTETIQSQIEEIEKLIVLDKNISELDQLIKDKSFYKAEELLNEVLQDYPENPELETRQKTITEALEEIQAKEAAEREEKEKEEERLRERQKRITNYKKAAEKYEKENNYDEAIEELNKVIKLAPNNQDIKAKIEELTVKSKKARERHNYFTNTQVEIKSLYDSKKYEECVETAEKLLRDYPEHKETLAVTLTECYIKLQKYKEAAKSVEPLATSTQNINLYNFAKGMGEYAAGNKEKAKTYLESVKNSKSSFKGQASSTLIIIFITDTRVIISISLFIIIIIVLVLPKLKDFTKSSNTNSASRKLEKIKESGNYEANFDFLKDCYENQNVTNMKLVILLYAAALQKKGDNEKAYQLICEYLKKDSRSPLAKNIAGETAMAIGETSPLALEHIQNLLKINENRTDAVEYLAKAYIQQKADHKLAQDFISKYISLNPNDSSAVLYLANLFIRRSNYNNQTVKTLEKAVRFQPDIEDYYVGLKNCYIAIGDEEGANKLDKVMKEKFPNSYVNTDNQFDYGSKSDFSQNYYGQSSFNQSQNYYGQSSVSQSQNYYGQSSFGQSPNYSATNEPENQSNIDIQNNNQNIPDLQSQNNYSQPTANTNYNQQSYTENDSYQKQQMSFQEAMKKSNLNNNSYPDYSSIGANELPDLNFDLNSFTDTNQNQQNTYNSMQQPTVNTQSQDPQQAARNIIGPKKNCPHCGAVNSATEYYCNSCGRPF